MLDIKNNYRGKYNNTVCRGCGEAQETQEHVLNECTGLHPDNKNRVSLQDVFNEENSEKELQRTATKIRDTMDKIKQSDAPPKQNMGGSDLPMQGTTR